MYAPTTRARYVALCDEPPPARPRPRAQAPAPPAPSLAEIARLLGTDPAALVGRSRARAASHRRQEAMWLLAERGHSEAATARLLGRDRATVRYGKAAVVARARSSPTYAARLAALAPERPAPNPDALLEQLEDLAEGAGDPFAGWADGQLEDLLVALDAAATKALAAYRARLGAGEGGAS